MDNFTALCNIKDLLNSEIQYDETLDIDPLTSKDFDWLEIAKEALEKQIPKKPTFEADGYDDSGELNYDTWICPCCEEHYEVDYDKYDFCPNCGQAIDWNEEEQ